LDPPGEIFGNTSLVFAGSSAGVFGTPGADTKARRARVYQRHNNGADSLFSALFISTHSLKIFRGMLGITQRTEKHSLCILLKGTLSAELFFKVYFVLLYLALFFSPDFFFLIVPGTQVGDWWPSVHLFFMLLMICTC